ncbi:MAG: putative peptidase c13 family protein [Streblomastix strix]|uniref:legumain n=1 Tax=Streblomastix strix TaxID=222440 RepID=A0A5J4W4Z2_9EUKA|nr:MAG: putative peptidase c13 family protein [Streblomastix strix]
MIALIFLQLIVTILHAENWAVLVAGSRDIDNYRHQSDVYRAYKILIKNGFPKDKVITMAFDDIATHVQNPFPGKVFNVPNGPDVYIGSDNIDYKGFDVTASNFYAILEGDSGTTGGKKVLKSTKNDNVFIFFDDHGASGLLLFPQGPYAYAHDIGEHLRSMKKKEMFRNLLFYVESCNSGSLFSDLLLQDNNIYALTSANSLQSSYAVFCGLKKYNAICLSCEFAQNWMSQSDKGNLKKITVKDQYENVVKKTKMSKPCQFGDKDLLQSKLSEFQSYSNSNDYLPEELSIILDQVLNREQNEQQNEQQGERISQTQTHLMYLKQNSTDEEFEIIKNQVNAEQKRSNKLASYLGIDNPNHNDVDKPQNMELYKHSIETYEDQCGRLNEFNLWFNTDILSEAIRIGIEVMVRCSIEGLNWNKLKESYPKFQQARCDYFP